MEAVATIALTMGMAWASGINLYAAILTLGVLGRSGHMQLPQNLEILQDPVVLGAAAVMYFLEFFADKIPGLDTVWDAIHTFIRIPAGAILAAQAVGDVSPAVVLAAALLGGALAAGTHLTKAGTRAMLNASPEPFTNWAASLTEDAVVIAGVWAAATHPLAFLSFLVIFLLAMTWLLPRVWRALAAMFARITTFFRSSTTETPTT